MSTVISRVRWHRLPDAPLAPDLIPSSACFWSREGQIIVWNQGAGQWRWFDTPAGVWSAAGTFPASYFAFNRPTPVYQGRAGIWGSPGLGGPTQLTTLNSGGAYHTWPRPYFNPTFTGVLTFVPGGGFSARGSGSYPWINAARPDYLWSNQQNGFGLQGLMMGVSLATGVFDRAVITDLGDFIHYAQGTGEGNSLTGGDNSAALPTLTQRFDAPNNPWQQYYWDFYNYDALYTLTAIVDVGDVGTPDLLTVQCANNALVGISPFQSAHVPSNKPNWGSAKVPIDQLSAGQLGLTILVETGQALSFGTQDDQAVLVRTGTGGPETLTWAPLRAGLPALPVRIGYPPAPWSGFGAVGLIGGVPFAIDNSGHFFTIIYDTVTFNPYNLINWTWPLRLH